MKMRAYPLNNLCVGVIPTCFSSYVRIYGTWSQCLVFDRKKLNSKKIPCFLVSFLLWFIQEGDQVIKDLLKRRNWKSSLGHHEWAYSIEFHESWVHWNEVWWQNRLYMFLLSSSLVIQWSGKTFQKSQYWYLLHILLSSSKHFSLIKIDSNRFIYNRVIHAI